MNREVLISNLIKAVKAMRKEQKGYFQTRQQIHLIKAKDLEREVDQKIQDFEKFVFPNQNQEKLEL